MSRRRHGLSLRPRDPDPKTSLSSIEDGPPNIAWLNIPQWDETTTIRAYQNRVKLLTGYSVRIAFTRPDGPRCPSPWTFEYKRWQAVQGAYRLLNYNAYPDDDDLAVVLAEFGLTRSGSHRELHEWNLARKEYRDRYQVDGIHPPGMSIAPIELAPAGSPDGFGPKFRSKYERRVSVALTRLGMRWDYEPDYFYYRDWTGRQRRYTPDFQLLDLHRTYVEVKGVNGADAGDQHKMRSMLGTYPSLTLLLWDATTVEYIEDLTDREQLLPLLRTTNLRAA